MALINCPECGKEISDEEEFCYFCGHTLKDKTFQNNNVSTQQINELSENTTPYKSIISSVLKFLGVIIFIIGILIGIYIITKVNVIYGIIFITSNIVLASLLYGVGEIIKLLQDIRDNSLS